MLISQREQLPYIVAASAKELLDDKDCSRYKIIVTCCTVGTSKKSKIHISSFSSIEECQQIFQRKLTEKFKNLAEDQELSIAKVECKKTFRGRLKKGSDSLHRQTRKIGKSIKKVFGQGRGNRLQHEAAFRNDLKKIRKIYGSLTPEQERALEEEADLLPFIRATLNEFERERAKSLMELNNNIVPISNHEWTSKTSSSLIDEMTRLDKSTESCHAFQLNKEVQDMATPLNSQVHTDGFLIGITQEVEKERGTAQRTKLREKDEHGFWSRGIFTKERALWLDIDKNGNSAFLSGTRQICFRLPSGARREARTVLDLSPLGTELTPEQTTLALDFIQDVCNKPVDEIPKAEAIDDDYDFQDLPKSLKKSLDGIEDLSLEAKKELIKLALAFNHDSFINTFKALFSLTPDIKDSCLDALMHIYGDNWSEHEETFKKLLKGHPSAVSLTKKIVDLRDEIQHLEFQENQQIDVIQLKKAVLKNLVELLKQKARSKDRAVFDALTMS